jgi:hypothetical protein
MVFVTKIWWCVSHMHSVVHRLVLLKEYGTQIHVVLAL